MRAFEAVSGDAGGAGPHRPAAPLRVTRYPADRHVDPEAGRRALLLGLAAPEAVLAVLARPVAAVLQDGTRGAHGPGLALAHDSRLRPLAGRGEEQLGATLARGVRRPRQGSAEDQVGDGLHGRQGRPPLWPSQKETPGSRWGATDPPSRPDSILTAGLESVQQLGSMA